MQEKGLSNQPSFCNDVPCNPPSELLRQEKIDEPAIWSHIPPGAQLPTRGVGLDANSNLTAATLQLVPRCPDGMRVDEDQPTRGHDLAARHRAARQS